MIEYINHQLNLWSEWCRTGNSHRLGYPKQAAFVRLMKGQNRLSVVIPDELAMDIGRAVKALEPVLRETVECYYISMRSCTAEAMAERMGCSRVTLYNRLDRAHLRVMENLNDLAAGIPLIHSTDLGKAGN